jgi:glycosyltransferase involved in cell wall biosynthesis
MTPKVTVIMSCYNHEKYVAESMDSILNQTYQNIELYVVNDGSTDRSAKIIKSYCTDSRVNFIDLKENTSAVGAFKILNKCIFETDSKYVSGASSDDFWELDKIEKQVNFLENNPSYKACFTWDKIKYEDGGTLQGIDEGYSCQENRDRFKWLEFLCLYGNCINGTSSLINRDVYMELGGFNWAFRNLQDYDLWVSIVRKYPIYIIPERLTI